MSINLYWISQGIIWGLSACKIWGTK